MRTVTQEAPSEAPIETGDGVRWIHIVYVAFPNTGLCGEPIRGPLHSTIPPGTRGVPHVHEGHESAIYTVSGETEVWHGEGLMQRTVVRAGDFMYVPPGIPHLPVNRSDVMTVAVVARTDPQEQESVVTMSLPPHLAELDDFPVATP